MKYQACARAWLPTEFSEIDGAPVDERVAAFHRLRGLVVDVLRRDNQIAVWLRHDAACLAVGTAFAYLLRGRMNRRRFLFTAVAGIFAAPLAEAQQAGGGIFLLCVACYDAGHMQETQFR